MPGFNMRGLNMRGLNGPVLAGCGAILLWSFLALLARMAAGLPPLQLTAMGFLIGGTASLALVLARGRGAALRQPPRVWLHGVGGLFGYHALYFAALALAPPVEANLLNYLWPLLIVLLAAPILGAPLGWRRLAGVLVGFAGCALLVAPGVPSGAGLSSGGGISSGTGLGLICAGAAALVWALYSVIARRLAAIPTEAVAGFCLATAVLAALAHLIFETSVMPNARQALAVLLMGLGPVGAAFFLWDIGMKRGDPQLLGTLAYATPLLSTLLLIFAGEGAFTPRVAVAALLVAGGGLVAARR